jgi:hypothetical protein
MSMSEEELGAGQYLDQTLDFEIDETGDVRGAFGGAELEKDLSFQMIASLSQFLGEQPTPELESDIKRMAYRVAAADVRVSFVDRQTIEVEWEESMKQMNVSMSVTTIVDEEYSLVFDV